MMTEVDTALFLSIDEEPPKCVLEKEPDQLDVLTFLAEYDYRWYDIGQGLCVRDGFLQGMRGTLNDKEKLSKILQLWMQTICSPVSWNHIKEALKHPSVNRPDIASKLGKFV